MDDNAQLNERAADVLVEVARAYRGRGLSDGELTRAGLPGVEKALQRWDPTHG